MVIGVRWTESHSELLRKLPIQSGLLTTALLTSEGSLRMTGENCKLVGFVGALRLRDEKDSIQNRRTGWSIMCVVYYVDWGTLGEGI